ncbi:MAG: hypothetical protein RLY71_2312 [Pseudomonadota bacterium]|jgi:hypothetical protein
MERGLVPCGLHGGAAALPPTEAALQLLIDAIRRAGELAPGQAPDLCLSAYLAVYGLAGVSRVANALHSS